METHLSEADIEALAHGRADLAQASARKHASNCDSCREAVDDATLLTSVLGPRLRTLATPDLDLDTLVGEALRDAAQPTSIAPVRRRDSLLGLGAGLVIAVLAHLVSTTGLPSARDVLHLARSARVVFGAIDQVISAHLPGGWTSVMLVSWGLLTLLAWPMRSLLRGIGPRVATAVALLACLSIATNAKALEIEGEFPKGERVSLTVEQRPTSEALQKLCEQLNLGLVVFLPDDPDVSVRVEQLPTRDVLEAVLGQADVRVERRERVLIVRATDASNNAGAGQLAVPSPPPLPPAPQRVPTAGSTASPLQSADDRILFGADLVVGPDERVGDAVAMGGDVTIEGVVEGDVVAMGGDMRIRSGARVEGELVSLGGTVDVEPGAVVLGRTGLGGSTQRTGAMRPSFDFESADEESWVEGVLSSLSKHALLFVLGLILLGLWPRRVARLTDTIRETPLRVGALGVLSALSALVAIIVLTVSLVGIPAALFVALFSALAAYTGLAATALAVGATLPLPRLEGRPVWRLAAGVTLLFLLAQLPWLGGLVLLVACLLGIGALVQTRFREPPSQRPLEAQFVEP
jgi:hypothetical protein